MLVIDLNSNIIAFDIGVVYITKNVPYYIQKNDSDSLVRQDVELDGESEIIRRFFGNIILTGCLSNTNFDIQGIFYCSENEIIQDLGPKITFRFYKNNDKLYITIVDFVPFKYYYCDDEKELRFEDIANINSGKSDNYKKVIPNIELNVSLKNNSYKGSQIKSINYTDTVENNDKVDIQLSPKKHGILQLKNMELTAPLENMFSNYDDEVEVIRKDGEDNNTYINRVDDIIRGIIRDNSDSNDNLDNILVESKTILMHNRGDALNIKWANLENTALVLDIDDEVGQSISVGDKLVFDFNFNNSSEPTIGTVIQIQYDENNLQLCFNKDDNIDEFDIDNSIVTIKDKKDIFLKLNTISSYNNGAFDGTSYLDRYGVSNNMYQYKDGNITNDILNNKISTGINFGSENIPYKIKYLSESHLNCLSNIPFDDELKIKTIIKIHNVIKQ